METKRRVLSLSRLILVPALVTLALFLLRLTGDLLRLPAFGPREVAWLVPLVGAYFGLRLAGEEGTPRTRQVLSGTLAPLALFGAGLAVFHPTSGAMAVLSVVALIAVRKVWPRLNDALLAYAAAARAPIVLVIFAATSDTWESAYGAAPFSIAAGLLRQLTVWFAFTVLAGTLSAGLVLRARRWWDDRAVTGKSATS